MGFSTASLCLKKTGVISIQMKVYFEEKTYESYFNSELDLKSSIYFPPGQVLEGLLGFDAAANSNNRKLWRLIGYPFWFYPHYSGVDLRDVAKELEIELEHVMTSIPQIKTNIMFQYKRPEYITTSRGKEWAHWGKEYFRYKIYQEQHELLSRIEASFGDKALVLYASPAIKSLEDLIKCKKEKSIIEKSNFKKASALNNHAKNTYISSGTYSIACSEPEKIENINILSLLESLEAKHDHENKSFIVETTNNISNIILENKKYSKSFRELMSEYEDLRDHSLIYGILAMKSFREITGVQWLISV